MIEIYLTVMYATKNSLPNNVAGDCNSDDMSENILYTCNESFNNNGFDDLDVGDDLDDLDDNSDDLDDIDDGNISDDTNEIIITKITKSKQYFIFSILQYYIYF